MVIEMDHAWGSVQPAWRLSHADQLIYLAGRHGYSTFLKVNAVNDPPCCMMRRELLQNPPCMMRRE